MQNKNKNKTTLKSLKAELEQLKTLSVEGYGS